jgi:PST family polysaccharide transporter
LGLGGTLLLTYFVARDALGEVGDAAVVVLLANQASTVGVGQYYVSKPKVGPDVAWHATVVHVVTGALVMGLALLLMHPLSTWMRAPSLARYLPGLVVAALVDRVSYIPERVLAREMRFRAIGLVRTVGEVLYTAVSTLLAMMGFGAISVVIANLARSLVRCTLMIGSVARATWAKPTRLSLATLRAMMTFGLPTSIGATAGFAARRVDNALVSGLLGVDAVAAYNLAYNLADVPAAQVGEQIGDVLLPSFAHMDEDERKRALERATGLLALVVFPLAVGLGVIAPTLVRALLRPSWADVAPMLAILSTLSITRPIGWTVSTYLIVRNRPRVDAALEVLKLASVVVLVLAFGRFGPVWACASVGMGFAVHAVASMWAVRRTDGIAMTALLVRCARPLAACGPMVLAVLAVRRGMRSMGGAPTALELAIEIGAGALAYIAVCPWLARVETLDALRLARRGLLRSGSTPLGVEPEPPSAVAVAEIRSPR